MGRSRHDRRGRAPRGLPGDELCGRPRIRRFRAATDGRDPAARGASPRPVHRRHRGRRDPPAPTSTTGSRTIPRRARSDSGHRPHRLLRHEYDGGHRGGHHRRRGTAAVHRHPGAQHHRWHRPARTADRSRRQPRHPSSRAPALRRTCRAAPDGHPAHARVVPRRDLRQRAAGDGAGRIRGRRHLGDRAHHRGPRRLHHRGPPDEPAPVGRPISPRGRLPLHRGSTEHYRHRGGTAHLLLRRMGPRPPHALRRRHADHPAVRLRGRRHHVARRVPAHGPARVSADLDGPPLRRYDAQRGVLGGRRPRPRPRRRRPRERGVEVPAPTR